MDQHLIHRPAESTVPVTKTEQGFSLLEVLFSMVILTVGIVSLLALFATALTSMSSAQDDLMAKQQAIETMESIYSARNTGQLVFDQINSTSACTTATPAVCGVFLTGWQDLKDPGPDGIESTADDGAVLTLVIPGPSGSLAPTATHHSGASTRHHRRCTSTASAASASAGPGYSRIIFGRICRRNDE